jgi:hypothetical protein
MPSTGCNTTWPTSNALEAGARRFALTLGRVAGVGQAGRAGAVVAGRMEGDPRPRAAACRFGQTAVNQIQAIDPTDAALLADDL